MVARCYKSKIAVRDLWKKSSYYLYLRPSNPNNSLLRRWYAGLHSKRNKRRILWLPYSELGQSLITGTKVIPKKENVSIQFAWHEGLAKDLQWVTWNMQLLKCAVYLN